MVLGTEAWNGSDTMKRRPQGAASLRCRFGLLYYSLLTCQSAAGHFISPSVLPANLRILVEMAKWRREE
jgi:hypothetical protein